MWQQITKDPCSSHLCFTTLLFFRQWLIDTSPSWCCKIDCIWPDRRSLGGMRCWSDATRGERFEKLACCCSSTCSSCWSNVCLFILAVVMYCCSRYGTTVGSFHTGGYSTCSLLKKTGPQRHPRWICLSYRRYNCCLSACMTLWMSLGSHVSKQSFQRSTFCG
jgi:hypothetical protein